MAKQRLSGRFANFRELSERALRLADSLRSRQEEALLYRQLATLRQDVPLQEGLDDLEWRGAREALTRLCRELGNRDLVERVPRWVSDSTSA